MLAEEAAKTPRAARDLYAQGVAAGGRALGDEAFAEYAGHFWGVIETRPYMRARLGLAQTLWTLGERTEALAHYEEMLRLNPGDNQGIRYVLLNALIALGEHDRAAELLKSYPDEMSAAWAYGRALCTFATEGATARATRELAHAKLTNAHVPAYLLRRRRLPRRLPDYYGMGDENEAVWYVSEHAESWDAVPDSHQWLEESMTASGALSPRPESFTRKAHRLFLNPYEDAAFTKCPACDQRTKVRKRYLVVHVEPGVFAVLNKSCRFCEDCDLLIVRQVELEPLLAAAIGPHYPAILGNDYLVMGTLDQKDGRQVRNSPPDPAWVLDHMSVF